MVGWYMELPIELEVKVYITIIFIVSFKAYSEQHILQKIKYKKKSPGPENVMKESP